MRGQYLERPTVLPCGELFLEGLFHRGRRPPAVLIVPPWASGGSPMEVPIVAELAWAMHRAQRATLRFNPRGLGASQGVAGGGPAERLADALAALDSLQQSTADTGEASPIAVLGVQSGAATALALAARAPIAALVLLTPPEDSRRMVEHLAAAGVLPPTLVLLAADPADPPQLAAVGGRLRVETVAGTDPRFVRGLPLFGQAVATYLDRQLH